MLSLSKTLLAFLVFFLIVAAANPSPQQLPLAIVAHYAWLAQISLALIVGIIALPSMISLVAMADRRSMVKADTEYWKLCIAYMLTFIALILVPVYTTLWPDVQYLAGFITLFAAAYGCDAFATFLTRRSTRAFVTAALPGVVALTLVFWFFTRDALKSAMVASHLLYLLYFVALIIILWLAARVSIVLTRDFRVKVRDAVALVLVSAALLLAGQFLVPVFVLELSVVRALLMFLATGVFYSSALDFEQIMRT